MGTDRTSRSVGAAPVGASRSPDGQPRPRRRVGQADRAITIGLRVTGAGLLIAAAAIHLVLYVTGYRSIPVIGGLFLLQVIAGFLVSSLVPVTGSRLAAGAGAMFALATLGAYLLSVWTGLFGFKEVRTTAGIAAGVVEVTAFVALAALAARPRLSARPSRLSALPTSMAGWLDASALGPRRRSEACPSWRGAARRGRGGCERPTRGWAARGPDPRGAEDHRDRRHHGAHQWPGLHPVLVCPDTPAWSACKGACAQYRPPVTGRPAAGPGVTGRLGAITRSDGSTQATYGGHPLYTYVADTGPGQANGNNLNLKGGLWHEVTVT
jgi:secreted repeat protein with Y-X4-D motif